MQEYINNLKFSFELAKAKKKDIIMLYVTSGLYNLANLLPPVATAGIIKVITNNNFHEIWLYVIMYVIFIIMYFSLLKMNYTYYRNIGEYCQIDTQKKLFKKIVAQPQIIRNLKGGNIIHTCSEDIKYMVDVFDTSSEALMKLIELIFIFIIFSRYNIFVALIVLGIDLMYVIIMNNNSKNVAKNYEESRIYEDKIIDKLNNGIKNVNHLKDEIDMKNINRIRKKWQVSYNLKRNNLTNRYATIPYLIYLGKIFLYVYLAYFVVNDKMKIEQLVLLISYFEIVITCTNELLENFLEYSNYCVRVKRIKKIIMYEKDGKNENN